jgi:hypothetical protein
MDLRRLIAGTALAVALTVGVGSAAAAPPPDDMPANCMGQHVSMMAQMYGGIAAATEHHNDMHGTNLTVGEHLAHIRIEMCGR